MSAPTPLSVEDWIARGTHLVTLPSGTERKIRLPNIQRLILAGALPQTVLAKMDEIQRKGLGAMSLEDIAQDLEFSVDLVIATVKDVELAAEQVAELPQEDVDAIVGYALRLKALPGKETA